MKANILIGGLLVAVALWACGDNDEASASHAEANWFTLEYDPNAGELDKLIYEIYDETGFPIFYNDTLKTQVRYDKGGKPYNYYEIFKTGYSYSGQAKERYYSLQRDEEKVRLMVELLRDYAIKPYLAKNQGPDFKGRYGAYAFLLLDTLFNGNSKTDSLYHTLGVTAWSTRYVMKRGSSLISVDMMTDEEKERFGWNFAIYELKRYLQMVYPTEFQAYFDVTLETPDHEQWKNGSALRDIFEIKDSGINSYNYVNKPGYNADFPTNPRRYGVLRYQKVDKYSVYFPTKLEDLMAFTEMIHTMSDAEIRAEHGEFPMIMKRYEMLLELLKLSGLTQFIKGE